MTDAVLEAAARAVQTESDYVLSNATAQRIATAVLAAVTPLIEANALEEAAKEAEVFSSHESWEVMSVVRRVAAALEEAARVADEEYRLQISLTEPTAAFTAEAIAAAIRALKPASPPPSADSA